MFRGFAVRAALGTLQPYNMSFSRVDTKLFLDTIKPIYSKYTQEPEFKLEFSTFAMPCFDE